jgi:fused signal recognition particle receptor
VNLFETSNEVVAVFNFFNKNKNKNKQKDQGSDKSKDAEALEEQSSDQKTPTETDSKVAKPPATKIDVIDTEPKSTEIAPVEIHSTEIESTEIGSTAIVKTAIESTAIEKTIDSPAIEPVQINQSDAVEAVLTEKVGFFSRLKFSLSRTKENIGSGFVALLKGKSIDDELYEELETQLLIADVGMQTTRKIINHLTEKARLSELKDGAALGALLKQQMRDILAPVSKPIVFDAGVDEQGNKLPFIILMVGVNGVGKTTTIGKLAKQFQAEGKKVMLAAGDTFRAAAVEQLQIWGERNNIQVIAQPTGADSASVIYDAVASAKAKRADVLIADTAGRLQNKDNLIEELKKVVRVMKKLIPQAPHEIMLTLDASTGQNAVSQTKIFNEAVGITGINLTKLDGTAKGGVIFALADEFNIPVRYIGIGEGIDDLRAFEATAFVDALFDDSK